MEQIKLAPEQVQEPDGQKSGVARSRFPTVGDVLAMLGIFLLANMVAVFAVFILGFAPKEGPVDSDMMGKMLCISALMVNSLTLFGIIAYRQTRGGRGPIARFSSNGFNPMLILWGFVLILGVGVVLEPLLNMLPSPNLKQFGTGVWTMLALVVVAPLFEEFICRGVVLESLRTRYGVIVAWLVSSIFFGVIHFQLQLSVNAFFIGLILAFLCLRANSIWIAIILHALNNAVGYLMLLLDIEGPTMLVDWIPNRTLYGVVYFAAAVLCVISAVAVWRTLKELDLRHKNSSAA